MKTPFLFLLGIIFGVLALYAYIHTESKKTRYKAPVIANMDFSAKDIRSLRTTTTGVVETRLEAKELRHYVKPAQYVVTDLVSYWKDDPHIIQMKANKATIDDNNAQTAILSGNVLLKRYVPNDTNSTDTLTLTTDKLVALPPQKSVYTHTPTHVVGPRLNVTSQYGLYANFDTGNYEFFQARMNYVPLITE